MALALDPIAVNTELAEDYLKRFNNFDTWPASRKYWHVHDYPDDKEEYDHKEEFRKADPTGPIGSYVARKLVEKIREHESTFYQLEYLIRKTDKTDFQNYILLMCQHVQCNDDSWNLGPFNQINICMTEKTPLHALGCVAAAKCKLDIKLTIVTTQKMAPICHLFADLCTQVGWTVNLVFINDFNDYFCDINGMPCNVFEENAVCFECTGVVTESADIDSALDIFINSSVTAPWNLQRIYVQESVYEEVKEALAARCGREVVPSCDDAFVANGKVFVCDALGEESGAAARVRVEAYRTARELCALLREQPAPALSLWAADSQLAHEVALAAPATLVWLNDYGSFHGPPASSLPLYALLYSGYESRSNKLLYSLEETVLRDLKKRWSDWKKLTKNQRIDSIMNTLCGLSSPPIGYDSVFDFQNEIQNLRDESFVSVDDGKICLCVEQSPVFEQFFALHKCNRKQVTNAIIALVNGISLFGLFIRDTETNNLLKSLEEAGAPVVHDYNKVCQSLEYIAKNILFKKVKVIRSNFGTIFAN